ncbi:hypothetical protein RNJ44_04493 [Nakaseomyces bracarensis]|uniref:Uncharacterized protein n=1 Tax=Nakaseomyces bracarensis TaxID=273131 RepID=A0ABR4NVB5_9SACH
MESTVLKQKRLQLEKLRQETAKLERDFDDIHGAEEPESNVIQGEVSPVQEVDSEKTLELRDHGVQTEEILMVDVGLNTEMQENGANPYELVRIKPGPVSIAKSTTFSELENSELLSKLERPEGVMIQNVVDRWQFHHTSDINSKICCIAIDELRDQVLVIYRLETTVKSGPRSAINSLLYLYNKPSKSVIKCIQFDGQEIVRGKFLRKQVETKVYTVVVSTSNGRIILCEFKETLNLITKRKTWKHNIVTKIYHHAPIYSIAELPGTAIGNERFITISVDGVYNKINTVTLDQDYQITARGAYLLQGNIIPPKRSDVLKILLEDGDDDNLIDVKSSTMFEKLFLRHMNKVTLFDEIGVTAVAFPPGEDNTLFVGSEDGAIYKLIMDQVNQNKIRVALDNNGFIPTRAINIENELFHSSHVTSLSFLHLSTKDVTDISLLLLSASLDKKACVWDTLTNNLLISKSEEYPILKAEWIKYKNTIYVATLTWKSCNLYKLDIIGPIARLNLHKNFPCEDGTQFTTFHYNLTDEEQVNIYLGTASDNIIVVKL